LPVSILVLQFVSPQPFPVNSCHLHKALHFYSVLGGVHSTVMSMSVCLFKCLSVHSDISKTTQLNFSIYVVHVACHLQSSSGNVPIRYIIPVLHDGFYGPLFVDLWLKLYRVSLKSNPPPLRLAYISACGSLLQEKIYSVVCHSYPHLCENWNIFVTLTLNFNSSFQFNAIFTNFFSETNSLYYMKSCTKCLLVL